MTKQEQPSTRDTPQAEAVPLDQMRPHPRNYRMHPADQLEHIKQSIRDHGFYRNVVLARDGTILAGHGVVEAARSLGLPAVPAVRIDIAPDDPRALKLLIGDNEVGHLGEQDDRILADMLRDLKEIDGVGLLGTGYDEMMLANLAMVTRPASEIADFDEAAAWVGMPEFDQAPRPLALVMQFANEDDREAFVKKAKVEVVKRGAKVWSAWYPNRSREDLASIGFK